MTDVVAGDTPLEILAGDGSVDRTYHGSWIHLSHAADVAATLHVEALEAPASSDGGTEWGGGYLASAGWPRADGFGSLGGLSMRVGSSSTLRIYSPEQDLFLFPTGWTYRVRVCEQPNLEPFPTCTGGTTDAGIPAGCPDAVTTWYGEGSAAPGACACMPDCATDADCPLPSTGDIVPTCVAGHLCALPCDGTSSCPDGQACVEAPPSAGFAGSFCMTVP